MTDQLRDLLVEIADDAPPVRLDPTTWRRARTSRRRREVLVATAAGLAALVIVLAAGVVAHRLEGPPAPPTERPDRSERADHGIPRIVHGVRGDGGLPLESDLALGRASVAVANESGAFVVTAADGEYHRLDLPGFDPVTYDDPDVRRTGMVGLSLSPDGSRLAYGWHDPLPEETGQDSGFVASGVRILDLLTGRTEEVPEDRRPPGEFRFAIDNQGFPWGVVPYGLRWSGDGRFLGYEQVWAAAAPASRNPTGHWGDDLGDAYHQAMFAHGASVYDTATGRRDDVAFGRSQTKRFWLSGLWWTGWPQLVSDAGILAHPGYNDDVVLAGPGDRASSRTGLPDRELAGGLWFGARLVLEQTGPATDLLAVHLRPSGKQRLRLHAGEKQWLRLDTGAVRVVLLGRIGPEQALAQVHRADGPRAWQEDAELRVLDVSYARVESTVAGRVEAQGTGSTFSFATDYATADHPTVDFSAAGEQGRDTVSAGDGLPAPLDDVTTGWWWVVALGAAALTAVVVAAWQRRRIRSP